MEWRSSDNPLAKHFANKDRFERGNEDPGRKKQQSSESDAVLCESNVKEGSAVLKTIRKAIVSMALMLGGPIVSQLVC